ncbi:ATP-binding protein [Hymenobacter crusticola]|uniref:histidine kinase n=1 Tax=Hymenobacter crusticola TaxID=1770526 RepID=A0A243W696_9BACT|nr:ATP-binding protein [Hymenobacter crusticola]OUJ69170.1 hypothetical protein BXP70_26855 [Hymenobacter crusticola]
MDTSSAPLSYQCPEQVVQARLAQWLQHAPEPVCVLAGPAFVYTLVNPAYQRLFPGRTLLGLPLLHALPELATHPIPQLLQHVYSTGEPAERRELLVPIARHAEGPVEDCYFNFTYQARLDEQGHVDGVIVFAHEVTEHVRTRERLEAVNQHLEAQVAQRTRELEQQRAFLRLVVDTLPNVIYVVQEDGELVFTNAACQHGGPCAAPVAALSSQSQPLELVNQLRGWRQQVLRSQQPLTQELAVALPSGETRHWQVHLRPFQGEHERAQVLVISTDVTALKQAQQQAEESARVQEAFLARMSHEIRTPLNGVLGLTALLEKTNLSATQQRYVHTMQRAGQQLLALVNDVLDLTKLSNAPLPLEQLPLDVEELVQGVAQTLGAVAEQQGLSLQVVWNIAGSLRVRSDANRLRQVLLNLLSNALKFTQYGQVQLGATVLRNTPSEVTMRFWVQDTGIGIAPEQQEHIFEAFVQASTDTSQHYGGTGLGLAISAQLVQQLGGWLHVGSALGEGTTFSFTLPLARADQETVAEAGSTPHSTYASLQGLRVLLAEDNLVNQWIATVMLEQWGVHVHAVTNGTEALAQLQMQAYDAALLDIQMPGLTGVEVTQAVRQLGDPTRAAVPIIALTANAFASDQQHYLAAGMSACLSKPFAEEALAHMLLQLTGSGRATAAGPDRR